jgi:hypothetical protein
MAASFTEGLMRPGSRDFMFALNGVLAALFMVMLTVIYTELENSIHAFVMLFLLLGLALSINWFVLEAQKITTNEYTVTATSQRKNIGKTD